MNNLSIHGFMAGIEAISWSKVGTIFYDFLENIDSLQIALLINQVDKLSSEEMFDFYRQNDVSDKARVSVREAKSIFKVMMNALNNTVDEPYFEEKLVNPVFM